jgi:hypothetical protein
MNYEISLFESALRAAVPVRPDPALGEDLVPRLARAARASTIEAETRASSGAAWRRGRAHSRRALVARVGIAVAMLPLVLAGLAFAGVSLPDPAQSAFDRAGISLPNQATGDSSAASDTAQPADDGTDESDTVSGEGNSHAAHQHALQQRQKAKGKALGYTRGKAIGLNELTPPGQSGDTGPPAHSNSGASARSDATPGSVKRSLPPSSRGRGAGRSK